MGIKRYQADINCLRIWGLIILLMFPVLGSAASDKDNPATQENPIELQVTVEGVQEKLLDNVLGYLQIYQFHDKTAPSTARVRFLHLNAEKQIQSALQAFGYYRVSVDGKLDKTQQGWWARYTIDPGPAIKLGQLDLRITGAGKTDPQFKKALVESKLKPNSTLNKTAYEALKKRFQDWHRSAVILMRNSRSTRSVLICLTIPHQSPCTSRPAIVISLVKLIFNSPMNGFHRSC